MYHAKLYEYRIVAGVPVQFENLVESLERKLARQPTSLSLQCSRISFGNFRSASRRSQPDSQPRDKKSTRNKREKRTGTMSEGTDDGK